MARRHEQIRTAPADERAARAHADECHRRLLALARAATVLPPREGNNAERPLVNGAYLVADDHEARFHAAVAAINDSAQARTHGLACEVTGPWPPYNFVNLDLSLPEPTPSTATPPPTPGETHPAPAPPTPAAAT
jgi:hypothetical protein